MLPTEPPLTRGFGKLLQWESTPRIQGDDECTEREIRGRPEFVGNKERSFATLRTLDFWNSPTHGEFSTHHLLQIPG
jgi:hypothetical protein